MGTGGRVTLGVVAFALGALVATPVVGQQLYRGPRGRRRDPAARRGNLHGQHRRGRRGRTLRRRRGCARGRGGRCPAPRGGRRPSPVRLLWPAREGLAVHQGNLAPYGYGDVCDVPRRAVDAARRGRWSRRARGRGRAPDDVDRTGSGRPHPRLRRDERLGPRPRRPRGQPAMTGDRRHGRDVGRRSLAEDDLTSPPPVAIAGSAAGAKTSVVIRSPPPLPRRPTTDDGEEPPGLRGHRAGPSAPSGRRRRFRAGWRPPSRRWRPARPRRVRRATSPAARPRRPRVAASWSTVELPRGFGRD